MGLKGGGGHQRRLHNLTRFTKTDHLPKKHLRVIPLILIPNSKGRPRKILSPWRACVRPRECWSLRKVPGLPEALGAIIELGVRESGRVCPASRFAAARSRFRS